MALTLTAGEVQTLCGVLVPDDCITVAKDLIYDQTGYTVDQHDSSRGIAQAAIRMAWAVVAVRVDVANKQEAAFAVTAESQGGDYSYSEDADLARHARFRLMLDGYPSELLELDDRAVWAHR